MAGSPPRSPTSLLEGVEQAVCDTLGIRRLRHRSALKQLQLPTDVRLAEVVQGLVATNWATGRAGDNRNRSAQNWRWTLQPQIGVANRSPEVVLERAIASACAAAGRSDWANQIPVASGLILGAADGRRALDLANRRDEGRFEFIELKIASDTPLYAAMELLGYASIWLLARSHPPARLSVILEADHIDLRVLAPADYYRGFVLSHLERVLDEDIRALGTKHGARMSFAFDVLPDRLTQLPLPVGSQLMQLIDCRQRLHAGASGD